jgi:hypothetical protein
MTRLHRAIRARLKSVEVPLFVITFLLGAYLAVGNIFDAANVPNKSTWTPWSVWFVLLLVAAVWVPVYALYQTVEARLQSREKRQTRAVALLARTCQQIVEAISTACPAIAVSDLAACVWSCQADDTFKELARFYLPQDRPPTGVEWRKGKGVAGRAWADNEDLRSDLRPLIALLEEIGRDAFDALAPSERFGLSAAELLSTRQYTGICAIRLFSTDAKPRLLGMLVLDYAGSEHFDCVAEQAVGRAVRGYAGICATVLTESSATI